MPTFTTRRIRHILGCTVVIATGPNSWGRVIVRGTHTDNNAIVRAAANGCKAASLISKPAR